jgi:hypothetical protein
LTLCAGLVVWRLWGQPFAYRDSGMFWMGNSRPPRGYWPMHASYNLPVYDEEFPYGVAVAMTFVLPIVWCARSMYRKWSQRALRLIGHCVQCGYDLRATPQRCPECGAVSPAKDVAFSQDVVERLGQHGVNPLFCEPARTGATAQVEVKALPFSPRAQPNACANPRTSPEDRS